MLTQHLVRSGDVWPMDHIEVPNQFLISYDSEFNFRQSINDCGPYSAAAMVRAVAGKEADSNEFASTMSWRLPRIGYHPWGLEKKLEEEGIHFIVPKNVSNATDEQKIQYLRYRLSHGGPIIILGEKNGYQHYVTLLGYNSGKDEFYIYDSWHDKGVGNLTVDDNGDLPGNRTLSESELMDFWRDGGMFGFYKWYAIVTLPESELDWHM
ncbi:MAG: papain-like cysteine protease family protein [bacterium]|nr:papain-like cysteine protease family protein [bacterium]